MIKYFRKKTLSTLALIVTKITAGMPSFNAKYLFIPFLKSAILDKLLKTWNTAVIPKTDLKSKNNEAIGTNRIEDPKPEIVPSTSETNASIMKT